MNYTIILALMGGLGLFLYGMKLMSDCLLYTSDAADELEV